MHHSTTNPILVLSIIVLALVALLFWRPILDWFRSRRIHNTATGTLWGYNSSDRNVLRVLCDPLFAIRKCWSNQTRGPKEWQESSWRQPRCGIGDRLAFRVTFRNLGNAGIPAGEIRIHDILSGAAQLIPGSVFAIIGRGANIPLTDDFIGREFTMAEIPDAPDELAGNTDLYIIYTVRVTPESTSTGGATSYGPPPPPA